ncbi:MAG: hypothetical protein DRP09_21835, partial [Candidatus Thorarchaeota archaeon]
MKTPESNNGVDPGKVKNSQDFLRQRLTNFGLTMIVMGICLPLHYLGLFGTVDGPLNPANLGTLLAGVGIAKIHMLVFFISLLIIAVTWNWIFNWVSLLKGSRLTCIKKVNDEGVVCGAPVSRKQVAHKKTGKIVPQYVCVCGHKKNEAHFHPIRKGTVSHILLILSLLFCVIILL